jgi:uncharacterized protein YuzE
MKITYYRASDILIVVFREGESEVQRLLDDDTIGEFDAEGKLLFISMKAASKHSDPNSICFSFEPKVVGGQTPS